jgi:hypothetical protein
MTIRVNRILLRRSGTLNMFLTLPSIGRLLVAGGGV